MLHRLKQASASTAKVDLNPLSGLDVGLLALSWRALALVMSSSPFQVALWNKAETITARFLLTRGSDTLLC